LENLTTEELIDIYASKAPVCHPGPQRKANRAARILAERGVLTPIAVRIARSHALDCYEGREEFDEEIKKWKNNDI